MEYYSAIERKAVLIDAVTWMNLEDIMLNEISQTQGQILCDSIYRKYVG